MHERISLFQVVLILFMTAIICEIPVRGGEAPPPLQADLDPLTLAQRELDRLRDDTHKREMKIRWPETKKPTSQALLESIPDSAEAYLINGYINYTCTRLRWKKETVVADCIESKRSWFYNPKGESFPTYRFTIAPADFARAWVAAQLLIGASAVPLHPKTDDPSIGDSCCYSSSSHEHYLFIQLTHPAVTLFRNVCRGMGRNENNIQDFETLKTQAIHSLFDALCSSARNSLEKQPFQLAEWDGFLTTEIKRTTENVSVEKMAESDRLFLETALRIVGQSGCVAAESEIASLRKKLETDDSLAHYWARCICEEAEFALIKIEMQNRWNPQRAIEWIHGNPRRIHAQNDLSQWMRNFYFSRDTKGYHELLLGDLKSNADHLLLRETLFELHTHFRGQDIDCISTVLSHNDPDVATDACYILLDQSRNSRPDIKPAIVVLDRLAGNSDTPIAPHSRWHDQFGRRKALEYMTAIATDPSIRWSADRVRKQLEQVEDGRIIDCLLTALDMLQSPASKKEEVAAYRRALLRPYSFGTLTACEELAKRNDVESAPIIRKILQELQAGCNAGLSWQNDPKAKFSWVDKYELEEIAKQWEKLETQKP